MSLMGTELRLVTRTQATGQLITHKPAMCQSMSSKTVFCVSCGSPLTVEQPPRIRQATAASIKRAFFCSGIAVIIRIPSNRSEHTLVCRDPKQHENSKEEEK